MFFTIEERSIIKMYHTEETTTKEEVSRAIEDAAAYAGDKSIAETMKIIVDKLSNITQHDFEQLDLIDVLIDESES